MFRIKFGTRFDKSTLCREIFIIIDRSKYYIQTSVRSIESFNYIRKVLMESKSCKLIMRSAIVTCMARKMFLFYLNNYLSYLNN